MRCRSSPWQAVAAEGTRPLYADTPPGDSEDERCLLESPETSYYPKRGFSQTW